ncbi:MAG: amino acid ABC transporter permease [Candidatus Limiplasma sp.]|nr:amino acid ABC transporter permease [Candidatus Limiplasma sp.]
MTFLTNIAAWFDGVKAEFILNFVDKNRWKLLLNGLGNTLLISLLACLIGIVLGVLIAIVRTSWDNTGRDRPKGFARGVMAVLNRICVLYTTVIRGTPVVIQLLIMYYVIFASSSNGLMVATIAFGLNSGAYVSEIVRGGILSVEKGQMEAGRSLGLNYVQTMWFVIAPQVLKTVLPTLANEFISLLKETSVAGYVAVADLTFAGNRIRGVTYSAFMPLIAVALIYLLLVVFLTHLVGKLERRLRQGDNR